MTTRSSHAHIHVLPLHLSPPPPPTHTHTYTLYTEISFRVQLLAQDQELGELRSAVSSLKAQKSSRDKAVKEMQQFKDIITSQDEQVRRR